ncbi:MAG: PEP-utilizing enzyme [Candidatus Micrarchaeota archaeon]
MSQFVFQWSESNSLMLSVLWGEAVKKLSNFIGKDLDFIFTCEKRDSTAYVSQENIRRSAEFSKKYVDAGFQKEFLQSSLSARGKMEELFQKVNALNLANLTNAQLVEFLSEYENGFAELMRCFIMSQAEFTDFPYKVLQEELSRAGSKNPVEDASILASPDKLDMIKKEELALAKLKQAPTTENLRKHAFVFPISFYNSYNEEKNIEFLRNRLAVLKAYDSLRAEMETELSERKKKQIQLEKNLSDKGKRAAWFLREIGWDRLELKNYWAGAEWRFVSLFKEVAKRMHVSLNDIFYVYSIPELIAYLVNETTISAVELKNRKNLYVVQVENGEVIFSSGEKAKRLIELKLPEHFASQKQEQLTGAVANRGKVQGIARVVKVIGVEQLTLDMNSFQKGEILVTTMTQPNMISIAKIAKAIVTDEGGMTSHAAIIARELQIPCIVGTHVATKVIKTGDLIEVDANKGVVRKL